MSINSELQNAKEELRSIIHNLYDVADGIEESFEGINQGKCAEAIRAEARKYEKLSRKLESINGKALDLSVLKT